MTDRPSPPSARAGAGATRPASASPAYALDRRQGAADAPLAQNVPDVAAAPGDVQAQLEAALRQAAEVVPHLVWLARPDGRHEWRNARWYAFTGAGRDDERGESWASVIHPDDRAEALARWERSLETGEPYEMECRLREAATGAYRWFLGRALPVRAGAADDGPAAPIVRWFGTCTDVHDRHVAHERAERLQRVTAALADAVTADDAAGAVVDHALGAFGAHAGAVLVPTADGAALTVLRAVGFPAEALAGWARLPLDARLPVPEAVRTGATVVVASAAAWRARYDEGGPLRRAVGSGSWVAVPLAAGGHSLGALALAFDREDAVGPEELPLVEALAGQCALALERARLFDAERAARDAAEGASRAKGDFLAVMSHELRTPLSAIGGHAELIADGLHGPVTDAQQAALARIRRAQRHLLTAIDDILRYARLDSGGVGYELAAVELAEVIADVGASAGPQALDKGLAFEARPPAAPCLVWADREQLARVLANLVANAVKFTEAGGRVALEVAAPADAPEHVQVCVHDTGVGIPPELLESVFAPFVQADGSRAREYEGAGLGLAISRALARGMGGDLSAASAPGAGATFTLTLRRAVGPGGAPTDRRGGGRRVADRRVAGNRRGEGG